MAELETLFGTSNPVYQAGMGGIAGPDLTAAVSNAGGLGHLGGIRMAAKDLQNWIQQTKTLTNSGFAVNLVPPGGGPDGFDAQLDVVITEKPKAVSLYWGDFEVAIPKLKAAGIKVMVQVGTVTDAKKALKDGADMLIAQGVEAGGHVKSKIGLMSILPAIVDIAGTTPVLAAGGLSTSLKIAAAMRLGAAGAWVGTSFVAASEANAHAIYQRRLIDATIEDTHHGHFYSYGWPIGTPYRVIKPKNNFSLRNLKAAGARPSDKVAFAKTVQLYAGQGVGDIKEVKPAARILAELSSGLS